MRLDRLQNPKIATEFAVQSRFQGVNADSGANADFGVNPAFQAKARFYGVENENGGISLGISIPRTRKSHLHGKKHQREGFRE